MTSLSTKNFNPEGWDKKLQCSCGCGAGITSVGVMIILEAVRAHFNKSVNITSGFRCEEYNAKIGGAKKSQHVQGTAVDFNVSGVPGSQVLDFLEKQPYSNLLGLAKGSGFVHVDTRGTKARWTY